MYVLILKHALFQRTKKKKKPCIEDKQFIDCQTNHQLLRLRILSLVSHQCSRYLIGAEQGRVIRKRNAVSQFIFWVIL